MTESGDGGVGAVVPGNAGGREHRAGRRDQDPENLTPRIAEIRATDAVTGAVRIAGDASAATLPLLLLAWWRSAWRSRSQRIAAVPSQPLASSSRTKPDVVVLDYHLPGDHGLVLCRRIKRQLLAPAVLLYSAYADGSLTIPARLPGIDGFVSKSAAGSELLSAASRAANGSYRRSHASC